MEYFIRQKIISIKDKFAVLDAAGNSSFYVRTKFFTFPKKMWLDDAYGNEVFFIKWRFRFFFPKLDLIAPNGDVVATITRKWTPMRAKYTIHTRDFGDYILRGSIFTFSFWIYDKAHDKHKDQATCEIQKKIWRVADTYSVRSNYDAMDSIFVALGLALDVMHHPKR